MSSQQENIHETLKTGREKYLEGHRTVVKYENRRWIYNITREEIYRLNNIYMENRKQTDSKVKKKAIMTRWHRKKAEEKSFKKQFEK